MREILIRLRGVTDWSQKDFAKYFHIPRRTLQEWELGNRKMPEYLLRKRFLIIPHGRRTIFADMGIQKYLKKFEYFLEKG